MAGAIDRIAGWYVRTVAAEPGLEFVVIDTGDKPTEPGDVAVAYQIVVRDHGDSTWRVAGLDGHVAMVAWPPREEAVLRL